MRDGNRDDSETGSFLGGFIIGIIAGAVAAVLFAPSSGEEARENLRQRGESLRETGSEKLQHARPSRETINEAKERATTKARIVLDNGKERFDTFRQSNGTEGAV